MGTFRFAVTSPGKTQGIRVATCQVDFIDSLGETVEVFPCWMGNERFMADWFEVINSELSKDPQLEKDYTNPLDLYETVRRRKQVQLQEVWDKHGDDRFYKISSSGSG